MACEGREMRDEERYTREYYEIEIVGRMARPLMEFYLKVVGRNR